MIKMRNFSIATEKFAMEYDENFAIKSYLISRDVLLMKKRQIHMPSYK